MVCAVDTHLSERVTTVTVINKHASQILGFSKNDHQIKDQENRVLKNKRRIIIQVNSCVAVWSPCCFIGLSSKQIIDLFRKAHFG